MRNDKVKLRLTVDVNYKLCRTTVQKLKTVLYDAVDHLSRNKLLSGTTEALVTSWTNEVVELDENGIPQPPPQKSQSEPSLPTEPGFWWAKERAANAHYDRIVEVYGDAPFLRLRAWDRCKDEIVPMDSWQIEEWGPRIEEPKTVAKRKED